MSNLASPALRQIQHRYGPHHATPLSMLSPSHSFHTACQGTLPQIAQLYEDAQLRPNMLRQLAVGVLRGTRDTAGSRVASRALATTAVEKAAPAGQTERFKPTDWFQEFQDPQIRSQLNSLRELEDDAIRMVSADATTINWDEWESSVKYPGLVKELKEIHENAPVPDVTAEKEIFAKKLDELFDPILAEFAKLGKEAEETVVELEQRASEVTFLRDNIDTLTVDEFLEKYPTVKASIEDDIANNRWFVSE
ncbi:unnamed protein product [Chondrus crispus]|uniref:Uncharacterized protein n=1 Tax=Chondrus crispus TaxID=2769 RepID=R7QR29_CHOCR|nr:unnamed protein product [Chondrus crispus]CDF39931.1 unnamed protein product [Chondrus crispus]|eukprot:XP_005710225.1 unnamed protein product [Chondrus crispus]